MPVTCLRYKAGQDLQELAEALARELPIILAPNLSISKRDRHDGQVANEDIIVRCEEGGKADVNTPDLEIIIWAHDFPERRNDLEERKRSIIAMIQRFLREAGDRKVSGFVWIILSPTAFGQL